MPAAGAEAPSPPPPTSAVSRARVPRALHRVALAAISACLIIHVADALDEQPGRQPEPAAPPKAPENSKVLKLIEELNAVTDALRDLQEKKTDLLSRIAKLAPEHLANYSDPFPVDGACKVDFQTEQAARRSRKEKEPHISDELNQISKLQVPDLTAVRIVYVRMPRNSKIPGRIRHKYTSAHILVTAHFEEGAPKITLRSLPDNQILFERPMKAYGKILKILGDGAAKRILTVHESGRVVAHEISVWCSLKDKVGGSPRNNIPVEIHGSLEEKAETILPEEHRSVVDGIVHKLPNRVPLYITAHASGSLVSWSQNFTLLQNETLPSRVVSISSTYDRTFLVSTGHGFGLRRFVNKGIRKGVFCSYQNITTNPKGLISPGRNWGETDPIVAFARRASYPKRVFAIWQGGEVAEFVADKHRQVRLCRAVRPIAKLGISKVLGGGSAFNQLIALTSQKIFVYNITSLFQPLDQIKYIDTCWDGCSASSDQTTTLTIGEKEKETIYVASTRGSNISVLHAIAGTRSQSKNQPFSMPRIPFLLVSVAGVVIYQAFCNKGQGKSSRNTHRLGLDGSSKVAGLARQFARLRREEERSLGSSGGADPLFRSSAPRSLKAWREAKLRSSYYDD